VPKIFDPSHIKEMLIFLEAKKTCGMLEMKPGEMEEEAL